MTKVEDIIKFLANKDLPSRIESINSLRNEYFCLVVMETIEMCERACEILNDKVISGRKLKAHVHPETSGKRTYGRLSTYLKPYFKEDDDQESANVTQLRELLENAKLEDEIRKFEAEQIKSRRLEPLDRYREQRDYPKKDYNGKSYLDNDYKRRDSREKHASGRSDRDYDRKDSRRSKDDHPRDKDSRKDEKRKDVSSPRHKRKSHSKSPKGDERKVKDTPRGSLPKPDAPEAGEVKPKDSKPKKEGSHTKTEGGSEKRKGDKSSRVRYSNVISGVLLAIKESVLTLDLDLSPDIARDHAAGQKTGIKTKKKETEEVDLFIKEQIVEKSEIVESQVVGRVETKDVATVRTVVQSEKIVESAKIVTVLAVNSSRN
jgi:hypothetical protein